MRFSDILSHDREIAVLKRAIISNRVAHAYIFAGIEGTGKSLVARAFARVLNCAEPRDADSCCRCASCVSFDNDSSLNYRVIRPQDGYLKVDQVRDIQKTVKYKVDSFARVVVVEGADSMQKSAGNAFLKTLEEPGAGTVIVLITSRPSMLLPTILSRCQRINFSPLTPGSVEAILTEKAQGVSNEQIRACATFSMGSITRAFTALNSGLFDDGAGPLKDILSSLRGADGLSILNCADSLARSDSLPETLDLLKIFIRDRVVALYGKQDIALISSNRKTRQGRTHLDGYGDFQTLSDGFFAVDRAMRDIMPPRNANKRLTLEVMLMELAGRVGGILNPPALGRINTN